MHSTLPAKPEIEASAARPGIRPSAVLVAVALALGVVFRTVQWATRPSSLRFSPTAAETLRPRLGAVELHRK